jgi:hypothetical protein
MPTLLLVPTHSECEVGIERSRNVHVLTFLATVIHMTAPCACLGLNRRNCDVELPDAPATVAKSNTFCVTLPSRALRLFVQMVSRVKIEPQFSHITCARRSPESLQDAVPYCSHTGVNKGHVFRILVPRRPREPLGMRLDIKSVDQGAERANVHVPICYTTSNINNGQESTVANEHGADGTAVKPGRNDCTFGYRGRLEWEYLFNPRIRAGR